MTPLRHRDGYDPDPWPDDDDHDIPTPPAPTRGPCDDPWQQPTTTKEPW